MRFKNMLIKLRGSTGRNWGRVVGEIEKSEQISENRIHTYKVLKVARREVGDILWIRKRLVVQRGKHLRERGSI